MLEDLILPEHLKNLAGTAAFKRGEACFRKGERAGARKRHSKEDEVRAFPEDQDKARVADWLVESACRDPITRARRLKAL